MQTYNNDAERAQAWEAVCKTMNALNIEWANYRVSGTESMCLAIRELAVDAKRYRAGRAIATEPDATIRDRMLAACDGLDVLQFMSVTTDVPTNADYDAFMDAMLKAATGARNADG